MRKSLEKVFDIIGEILAVLALILYVFLAIKRAVHVFARRCFERAYGNSAVFVHNRDNSRRF